MRTRQIQRVRSSLWANRPDASLFAPGEGIFFEDIGPHGSWLYSDGVSDWHGTVTLASDDITAITTTQTTTGAIAGWSLTLPGGLFSGVGTKLRGMVRGYRSNLVTGNAQLSLSALDVNSSLHACHVGGGSTTNPTLQAFGYLSRVDSTHITQSTNWGTAWSGTNNGTINQFFHDETTPLTIYLAGNVAGVGETLAGRDILLELIKP